MKLTGAEIFIQSLINEGVEVIFGYPGGVVLGIYDALFDSPIRHVLTRHEQGASHAADGYARATGKVGVCIATSGPGATNLVTGIATAYMDSVPIVAFTGQVPTSIVGTDAFQEADIVGITRPITKHNYLVKDVNEMAKTIKEAFHIARTGRPGPVLIDLPKDVIASSTDFKYPPRADLPGYNPTYSGNIGQIIRACKEIIKAKRPVIYGGGGVIISQATEELKELAEKLQIPVTTTLLGLGGFPADNPLFLGMLGMHGTYYANMSVTNSDLLIAIGTRFDDRVTGKIDEFAPNASIIHIDIDPSAISKNIKVHIPIVGDAKDVLRKMLNELDRHEEQWQAVRKDWLKQINYWKENYPLTYINSNRIIKPQYVIEKIWEITRGEAIVATEVGQNQMWAAQFYRFNYPRRLISSGGLGTMGYGFPAAIGAQIGCPDKIVFDIAGDGSFQMNIQELATAVQNRLPIKIAIINNQFLGMVRQWQELFYDRRYSETCLANSPDFVKIAEAYGAVGLRAEAPDEVVPVLEEALSINDTPVVIDFVVDREENVYPMVPAGKSISDMLVGPSRKSEKKLRAVK
jgi:acetolactate synthase-1/2/3 large subunit